MTGWGFMDWIPGDQSSTSFWGGELSHDEFIDWSAHLMGNEVARPDSILCEGFNVNMRTIQQAPDDRKMWSVKQLGHLETLCRWNGLTFIRCMPSDKSFDEKGDKLKALGWWAPAPGVKGENGHRRDAGRHAVKWGVDHNIIDRRRLLP